MKTKKVVIKRNKLGKGVYAGETIKKGDVVWMLAGKKISQRNFRFASFDVLNNVLQVGAKSYVTLDRVSLLFNHSCQPNLGVCDRSTLIALRNIKKGEQLFYDYATTMDESFQCQCGSPQCRGVISDFFSLPKSIQQDYFKKKALPDFIINKMVKLAKGLCPCGSGKKYKRCHGA